MVFSAATVGSSTGVCSALPWKIVSLESLLIGSKEFALLRQGPLSRVSPMVTPLDKNPERWTSM